MPTSVTIRIDGNPVAQPRPRAFARSMGKGKAIARVYNPDTADGWKKAIWVQATRVRPTTPYDGPVRVDAEFYFARPQRLEARKYPARPMLHTAKPDRDNLDKALLDALTEAGIFNDDAQVCAGGLAKFYVARGQAPGAVVRITFLQEDGQEALFENAGPSEIAP